MNKILIIALIILITASVVILPKIDFTHKTTQDTIQEKDTIIDKTKDVVEETTTRAEALITGKTIIEPTKTETTLQFCQRIGFDTGAEKISRSSCDIIGESYTTYQYFSYSDICCLDEKKVFQQISTETPTQFCQRMGFDKSITANTFTNCLIDGGTYPHYMFFNAPQTCCVAW